MQSEIIVKARDLLIFNTRELFEFLEGDLTLIFDDGQILKTNSKEVVYTSFAWELIRQYPNTPLLKDSYVQTLLKNKPLQSKTHLTMFNKILWSVVDTYGETKQLVDTLAKLAYQQINEMHNLFVSELGAYVLTLDIVDYIDFMEDPQVSQFINNVGDTENDISDCYSGILENIENTSRFTDNSLAKSYRFGIIKQGQFLQSVGPLGFRTDMDSTQFRYPVKRGFVKGINLLYDLVIESRSAAKSLYFQKEPLKETEYFARRLQLLCMTVEKIIDEDCGSTNYLLWRVKPPIKDSSGSIIYEGDLKTMTGKYYLDEDSGSLKSIGENDSYLYNKLIKLRSPIGGCMTKHPHGVCKVCFGGLASNIPEKSNVGHICAATVNEQSSQSVLSVKHSDGSSTIESIILEDHAKKYLSVSADGGMYLFNPPSVSGCSKIVIDPNEALGLTDIKVAPDIKNLTASRITELAVVGFVQEENEVRNITPVDIKIHNRLGSFTHEFLQFLKDKGWDTLESGVYEIDLDGWDYSVPAITLPKKHFNMVAHAASLAEVIESKVKDLTDRSSPDSPAATLGELHELVNSKLSVHLSVLEIIMYATMIIEIDKDYKLPKPWTSCVLGVASNTIPNRSEGGGMAYENHRAILCDPASFIKEGRPSSPMDALLLPREAVQAEQLGIV